MGPAPLLPIAIAFGVVAALGVGGYFMFPYLKKGLLFIK